MPIQFENIEFRNIDIKKAKIRNSQKSPKGEKSYFFIEKNNPAKMYIVNAIKFLYVKSPS